MYSEIYKDLPRSLIMFRSTDDDDAAIDTCGVVLTVCDDQIAT